MTKLNQNNIQKEHLYVMLCGLALVVLALAYMYFLSVTVVHVVMQKEIRKEINSLDTEIALLEADYIKKQHAMSNNVASLQGFVASSEKIFIDRTDTSLVLSGNGI